MNDILQRTAPCGLACFECEIHEDNITGEFIERFHAMSGVPREKIPCRGCRREDDSHFHLPDGGCETKKCAAARGVDLCADCGEFPCERLAPLADGAERYPHNLKLYNLCRIRRDGLEAWAAQAGEIKRRYATREFVVGRGQADRSERD